MRLVLAVLVMVGCGDPPDPEPVDTIDAGDSPVPAFPSMITVGAADGTIAAGFSATVAGTAQAPLGQISILGGAGTFEHVDSTSAFLYMTVPFAGYTLYQGFGISPKRWDVFWLYCKPAGLDNVYAEGVSGPALFDVAATGMCSGMDTPTSAHVTLPGFELPTPKPLGGYTVRGPDIFVRGDGAGSITLGGKVIPLLVFGDVDCSACGSPGWYELHSIIWDEATHHVVFAIVYLMSSSSVEITYARSLPDLGDPIGVLTLPATWTSPARPRNVERRHLGMPPPAALGR
jgi:hypothetical protein